MKPQNNQQFIYKYRSMENLFKFNELEEGYIHFSHFSDLNDPLEGYIDIDFIGDRIIWENFFRNFVYSYIALSEDISTNHDQPEIMTDNWIFARFFRLRYIHEKVDNIKKLKSRCSNILLNESFKDTLKNAIDNLSQKYEKHESVYKEELLGYLSNLHDQILLIENKDDKKYVKHYTREEYLDKFNREELIFESCELHLESFFNNSIILTKLQFILDFFPYYYLEKLKKLMFINPVVSSFSQEMSSLAMWAYYADSSKGVCLKFKTNDNYVVLYRESEDSKRNKICPCEILEVSYEEHLHKIPLINMGLGKIDKESLHKYFYTFEGVLSELIKKIQENINESLIEQRKKVVNILNTKLYDWQHENECRIIILDDVSRLYYPIGILDGIIFGINANQSDKLRVISILENKIKNKIRNITINLYNANFDGSKVTEKQFGIINYDGFKLLGAK